MFVIAGVTGHVGSVVADELIKRGKPVKVIVRDAGKGAGWSRRGAEVAVGSLTDEAFLTATLKGAAGAFLLLPPDMTATDIIGTQKRTAATLSNAVKAAGVPHVVMLSSHGAELPSGTGPIAGLHYLEEGLRATGARVTIIRAGSFQENVGLALAPAKHAGIYPNFFPSRDLAVPMIATRDIGQLAAEALVSDGKTEIVDIQGPSYSVAQLAEKLGRALGKTLNVVDVPPAQWVGAMTQGGVPPAWAESFAEMYGAAVSGKLQPKGDRLVQGKTEIDEVIKRLVA